MQGRVEVDRMRGKEFEGQSGRSHKLYDDAGGRKAAEWLIEQVERKGLDQRLASEDRMLRSKLIRLAHARPDLRPHLLPLLHTASVEKQALAEVGGIIIDQMGGLRRLKLMLGISAIYDLPGRNGVGFVWPNRERSKGNNVEVELTPMDTYEVRFYNTSGGTKKLVKSYDDVYAEDLVDLFEKQTGWYLRL